MMAGALIAAVASCTKENDKIAEEVQPVSGPVTLSASIDNEASTKATLDDGSGAFAFSASDAIKVHNGTGAYTGTTAEGGTTAIFTMEDGFADEGSGLAAFPAGIVSEITASKVTFILPTSYAYSEVGSSDASAAKVPLPMIATYTAGSTLSFKQAGSVVRIRVTNIAAGNLSFTFPTKVTGEASLTAVPSGDGEGILAANFPKGKCGNTITVTDVPAITSGSYAYITLPVPTGTAPQGILVVNNPSDASASRMAAIEGNSTALNRAGGYKLSASPSEIATPSFKVSDTKTVVIAPGNLMAHVSSYSGGSTATADRWKFGGYFECIGRLTDGGNYFFYGKRAFSNKWIDLFAWQGASLTESNKAHGLVNEKTTSKAYHGDVEGESLYDGCWNGLTITNGGAYTWRPMTNTEWSYLLTDTGRGAKIGESEKSRFARATVAGENGLLIFPDSDSDIWNTSTMGTVPTGINSTGEQPWGTTNNYTASNFVAMYGAGIVFLPAAGYWDGWDVSALGSNGRYWSSTASNDTYAYHLYFNHGGVDPSDGIYRARYYGMSVRLVREL